MSVQRRITVQKSDPELEVMAKAIHSVIWGCSWEQATPFMRGLDMLAAESARDALDAHRRRTEPDKG